MGSSHGPSHSDCLALSLFWLYAGTFLSNCIKMLAWISLILQCHRHSCLLPDPAGFPGIIMAKVTSKDLFWNTQCLVLPLTFNGKYHTIVVLREAFKNSQTIKDFLTLEWSAGSYSMICCGIVVKVQEKSRSECVRCWRVQWNWDILAIRTFLFFLDFR